MAKGRPALMVAGDSVFEGRIDPDDRFGAVRGDAGAARLSYVAPRLLGDSSEDNGGDICEGFVRRRG